MQNLISMESLCELFFGGGSPKSRNAINWFVLSDEQMRKWVGVKHLPVNIKYVGVLFFTGENL